MSERDVSGPGGRTLHVHEAGDPGGVPVLFWGFDLAGIDTPVLVQHGEQDAFVPVAHGRWLAAAIPDAEARIHPDEGHVSLTVNRLEESYDWLLERVS